MVLKFLHMHNGLVGGDWGLGSLWYTEAMLWALTVPPVEGWWEVRVPTVLYVLIILSSWLWKNRWASVHFYKVLDTSLTQWTWFWVSSRSWWWTGKPGVLQSMGSQRVGHDWATELKRHILSSHYPFSPELCWNILSWSLVDLQSTVKFSVSAEACVVFHTWRGWC